MPRHRRFLIALVLAFAAALPGEVLMAERLPGSDAIGAEEHPLVLAQMGGAIGDNALAAYVDRIGRSLIAATDESRDSWTFSVLDSPAVNAFALPGGYVYVTRGLLAIANSEAELAGVLGHEIGHVTAHHGEDRIKRSNRAGIGVVIGTILGGVLGGKDGASDAIQLGARLAGGYLARHSQSEEIEADRIGVGLLVRAGYDPHATADFLEQLAAKEELERRIAGEQYNPNVVDFFSSHPATGKRTRLAAEAANRLSVRGDLKVNEAGYLAAIDGMIYGDTAREGFIRGRSFSHPEMRFTITLPEGFILQNSPQQVTAFSKSGARFILNGDVRWIGAMDRYIATRWSQAIAREVPASNLRDVRNLQINGVDAAMALMDVMTAEGPRIAQLVALRLDDETTIRLVGLTTKSDGATRNALNTALQSFRRLSDHELESLQVYRLRVVTVSPGDTVESLARTMPLTGLQAAQFRAMNGYRTDADMRPGDLVKIVK